MSTANKLTYLNTTKQNLKTVINTTGAGLTDESTFRSYANVLNDKILGAINGDVDLFEEYPKVSGNGADLSLNGVVEGKMSITPQGASKQGSTTGKNLLNSITDTTTRNGITFTKNSDGTYTLNGTSTSGIDFNIASDVPLDLNTSYILSGSPNTASNTTYRIMGACTRENDSTTYIADNDGSGVTIPSSKMIRVYINVKNGKTLNNVIFKPMIRLASITDDTYEPYTGGIPAPSPSYPFPVKTVTGENILVISNSDNTETQTYPISLGNIELNSSPDGTIRDGIVGKPNEWYKREYIGKTTDVSGSTSITINDMVSDSGFYSYYGGTLSGKTITYDSAISGINTIWYQKEQYTDIPITDTTLINQLNNIYNNAHSYNGVTNITTTYEDGNEQMYLDIEALKNVWEVTE